MQLNYNAKRLFEAPRGRPRIQWINLVFKDLQKLRDIDWRDVTCDRPKWR